MEMSEWWGIAFNRLSFPFARLMPTICIVLFSVTIEVFIYLAVLLGIIIDVDSFTDIFNSKYCSTHSGFQKLFYLLIDSFKFLNICFHSPIICFSWVLYTCVLLLWKLLFLFGTSSRLCSYVSTVWNISCCLSGTVCERRKCSNCDFMMKNVTSLHSWTICDVYAGLIVIFFHTSLKSTFIYL